jgi:two-component system sensor histidine kinase KdpD
MERISLAEKERQASLILESDRLRTALLNSVSHELKTPLSFIIGSVSSLLDTETIYSEEAKHELLESIREGANRMERIIANLLDTARIESGMMHLKHDWCDIEDIIGTALRRLNDQLKNRPLIVDISVDIPLLKADCVLLEQVVVNLLDNALKYSPAKSPLEITVTYEDAIVQVSVADKGIGIPKEDLARIFDKFYRVKQRTVQASGTGLGLSICKSIIEAHKGRIWAENRPEGGTIISFSLPAPETEESKR